MARDEDRAAKGVNLGGHRLRWAAEGLNWVTIDKDERLRE